MDFHTKLKTIADKYKAELLKKIDSRKIEMESDNHDHYIIYNALGVSNSDGDKIDLYQNTGRFLYKYAGAFCEDAMMLAFQAKDPNAKKIHIDNTVSSTPKRVEIDCLIGNRAHEFKWRDATTDGDHIHKEENRLRSIKKKGYVPIRVMLFEPNRKQAIKIQENLRELYLSPAISGEYYSGIAAWSYIKKETGIDLLDEIKKC